MRALSLTQPWATLVAIGAKQVETRAWGTSRRERIAIHAAKGVPRCFRGIADEDPFRPVLAAAGYHTEEAYDLPHGAVIAVATIASCRPTDAVIESLSEQERSFGDYGPGRWAWRLTDVRALPTPIPCRGMLSLWTVPADVEEQIEVQLFGAALGAQLAVGATP